jgi:hypothetical protein
MDDTLNSADICRHRRFIRRQILKTKRLKPRYIPTKISIRRGCMF